MIDLGHLYSARLKGVFCSLAIMDIRAHPISFETRPRKAVSTPWMSWIKNSGRCS
jgi:hypothetical protein